MRILLRLFIISLGLLLLLAGTLVALARRQPATSSYWLAYVSEAYNGRTDLYLSLPDGSSRIRLIENVGMVHRISFAPDSSALVFDGEILADAADPTQGVFRTQLTNQVYLLTLEGRHLQRLTNDFLQAFAPAWSPDGQWISFMADDGKRFYASAYTGSYYPGIGQVVDGYQVYLMRADGSQLTPLTSSHEYGRVYWSPDSQWIAYVSTQTGDSEIYKMSLDGSRRQRLTFSPSFELSPTWSPDGRYIAFLSDRENMQGTYNIFVMDTNGMNVRRLTNSSLFHGAPTWSPDGEWIGFVRREVNGIHYIYRVRPDGTDRQRLTPVNGESSWAPAWSRPIQVPWRGIPVIALGGLLLITALVIRRSARL